MIDSLMCSSVLALALSTVTLVPPGALHSGGRLPGYTSPAPDSLKITVWNINKGSKRGFYDDFARLASASDIVLIQEGLLNLRMRNLFAELGDRQWLQAQAWLVKQTPTGVAALVNLPAKNPKVFLSSMSEPIFSTPKSSLMFTVNLQAKHPLLVINTHALNFTSTRAYAEQLKSLVNVALAHQGPLIWAGDFNSWKAPRSKVLLQLTSQLQLEEVEWENQVGGPKIDRVFVRGLRVNSAIIRDDIGTSDHYPLQMSVSLI